MNKTFMLRATCAAALLAASAWAAAETRVVGFDDLTTPGALPALYGGIDWSASSWIAYDTEQAPYTAHSGFWRATTDWGSSDAASTIRFIDASVFDGAWFSGFADATVTVQMFLGDALVATSATLVPGETPSFLASGYAGLVDRLVFVSPQQSFYAMDDLSYQTSPVPEPQGWLLMACGLAALAARARRRH